MNGAIGAYTGTQTADQNEAIIELLDSIMGVYRA